jgi:hypothetical protein
MSFVPTKSSSPSVVTAALWLLLLLLLLLLRDGSCIPAVVSPLLSSLLKKRVWTNVGEIVFFRGKFFLCSLRVSFGFSLASDASQTIITPRLLCLRTKEESLLERLSNFISVFL